MILYWAEFFRTWLVFSHCWILTRNNDNYQFKRKKYSRSSHITVHKFLYSEAPFNSSTNNVFGGLLTIFKLVSLVVAVYSFRFCILSWCKISKWNWILLVCMSTFNLFCKIEFFSAKKRKNVIKLDTTLNTHTHFIMKGPFRKPSLV